MKIKILIISLFLSLAVFGQSKLIKIPATIFPVDVFVLATSDLHYALNFVQETVDSTYTLDSFIGNVGVVFTKGGNPAVLWLRNLPRSIEDYAVLNHEIFHVIAYILKWANVPLSKDTEEVYAYMTSYYTQTIYVLLK